MIRALLVDRSGSGDLFRWSEGGRDLAVSLLSDPAGLPDALAGQEYDIILLSLHSGDSAAIETLRQIRIQDPRIPCIVISDVLDGTPRVCHSGARYLSLGHHERDVQKVPGAVVRNLVRHRDETECSGQSLHACDP